MKSVGKQVRAIECSNDDIIPVEDLENDSQKIIIFDGFVCEEKPNAFNRLSYQKNKNCSVIYLTQSFFKTRNDIRLNCSHFYIYDFPRKNERGMITRELGISKKQYERAIKNHTHFQC